MPMFRPIVLHPSRRLPAALRAAAAGVLVLAAGCGGGGTAVPPPAGQTGAGSDIATPPPPITTDRGEIFNVTFHTRTGEFPVDKLEIEFNRRRGIHQLYGFYRDSYMEMARIPFAELSRIDFLGEMPPELFSQATVGREQEKLSQDNAFQVRLTYRDGRQEEFFAIIPKFRGEKDLVLWEYPMSNQNLTIEYIDFDR
jgi:hypothetical protein